MRTITLLLVATYTENMYPSVCVEAVEKLGGLAFTPVGRVYNYNDLPTSSGLHFSFT